MLWQNLMGGRSIAVYRVLIKTRWMVEEEKW